MLPGHATEIINCLGQYPLEVIAWAAAPVASIVSLTAVVVRSLYLKQIGNRDSEISVLKATHGLKDTAAQSWKEKYEQAQTALAAALQHKPESTTSKALTFFVIAISLLIGAGAGIFGTRLYDSTPFRDVKTKLSQSQSDNQQIAGQLASLIAILPEKNLAKLSQHSMVSPKQLDAALSTPVVVFDGLGNVYKFAFMKGKLLHVKTEAVNSTNGKNKPHSDESPE